jgi:voltage-gated potassium channel
VPLSLALVPLGVLLSYRAMLSMLGMSGRAVRLDELANHILGANLGGLSDFVVGGLLIVTAYGLVMRSRLAWWLAVLGLCTSLVIQATGDGEGAAGLIVAYRCAVLLSLLGSRSHFSTRSLSVHGALGLYVVVMFMGCATVLTLRRGTHFDPEIHDPISALYFVVMTVSTVGFGDIVPRDPEARGFVLGLILIGVLVIGSVVSVFLIPLIGTSALARNVVEELETRGQVVAIVVAEALDDVFYRDRDVLVGDPTDLEVLRVAGTEKARGVLALSEDDATNGFIVLGVNELNSTIPTVAALNDPRNRSRLERTQPSILLSLQVLGGQLLAMALTGERVENDFLESVLRIRNMAPKTDKGPEG